MAESFIEALNVTLAPRGIKLEFRDGDLWIGARSAAEAQQFEAEHGEIVRRLRGLLRGESTSPTPNPAAPVSSDSDPSARWRDLNRSGSLDTMMGHAMGGEAPPREVPIANASIPPSVAKREEYQRAPRYNGYIIATPEFQGWLSRYRDWCRNPVGTLDEWLAANPAPYRFPWDGGP
jgi:hypothetical protein